MNVIQLPQIRASGIDIIHEYPLRLARSLATQYWRRSRIVNEPARSLMVLSLFDNSIVEALFSLKTHLIHAPEITMKLLSCIAAVEKEIQSRDAVEFASVCIELLSLQANNINSLPADFWGERLAVHPDAFFDAFRFCFDPTIGDYLARGVEKAFGLDQRALSALLFRLAIARPAVSDGFAEAVANATQKMVDGRAVLCKWRCLMRFDEKLALRAIAANIDAESALAALSLMSSTREHASAVAVVKANPTSKIALAILVVKEPDALKRRLSDASLIKTPLETRLYCAAMLGDSAQLRRLQDQIDWDDSTECRALTDSVGLLSGRFDERLYDITLSAGTRERYVADAVGMLNANEATRLNQPRQQVMLDDCAPLVGSPLRQMLFVEYAARVKAALWIEADDLSGVQGLAISAASLFERAAFARVAA